MFSMAMWMLAVVAPIQIFAGDAHGLNTLEHQPVKVMAMEGHYDSHPDGAPLILFGKGNAPHLGVLADSGAEAVGVDWTVTLEDAAWQCKGKVALQGNLDPATLYASPDVIAGQVQAALDSYARGNGGSRDGHVFNLGHGMSPDMDPEHVAVLVEAVHAESRRLRRAAAAAP